MLTSEQITKLPEKLRAFATQVDEAEHIPGLSGDIIAVPRADVLCLLATLADGYAPPGKLLVSVADMRAFLECGITGECPAEDCPAFAECDRIDPEEVSADRCRAAYRAHFGIAPEAEATDGTTAAPR